MNNINIFFYDLRCNVKVLFAVVSLLFRKPSSSNLSRMAFMR